MYARVLLSECLAYLIMLVFCSLLYGLNWVTDKGGLNLDGIVKVLSIIFSQLWNRFINQDIDLHKEYVSGSVRKKTVALKKRKNKLQAPKF